MVENVTRRVVENLAAHAQSVTMVSGVKSVQIVSPRDKWVKATKLKVVKIPSDGQFLLFMLDEPPWSMDGQGTALLSILRINEMVLPAASGFCRTMQFPVHVCLGPLNLASNNSCNWTTKIGFNLPKWPIFWTSPKYIWITSKTYLAATPLMATGILVFQSHFSKE